jgi:hypothetical protein
MMHDTRAWFLCRVNDSGMVCTAKPLVYVPMSMPSANTALASSDRKTQIRAAVLQCFCDPLPQSFDRLTSLSARDWQRLLYWLDVSGLALYFFDRLDELQRRDLLPEAVAARLEQNLLDNTVRTRHLMDESATIQTEFQRANLSYAVLKGFSLCPISVPRPELRSQLDLDFLVSADNALGARHILERCGFRLHAISGRSWEFKTVHPPGSLADLYKPNRLRSIELHLEPSGGALLRRLQWRDFHGISSPVLPAADLFLGQAAHLFKHICSAWSRTAHLIEFRRHVIARQDDLDFWQKLRATAGGTPQTTWALGLVSHLITHLMSDFAPRALTCWTVDCLPPIARLWVETYGLRTTFAIFPGTKLYLILQREFETAGLPAKRPVQRSLLPLRLPPPIAVAPEQESLTARVRRHQAQMKFVLSRLRFHVVEGVRFAVERKRWQKTRKTFQRQSSGLYHRSSPLPIDFAGNLPYETKE